MGDDLDTTVRMSIDPKLLSPYDKNNLLFMEYVEGVGVRSPIPLDVLKGGLAIYVGKTTTPSNNGPLHHYTGIFPRHEGMIKIDVERCKEEFSAGVKVLNQGSTLRPKISDPIGLYRLIERIYEER